MFKIEKNIKIQEKITRKGKGKWSLLALKMKIRDSVLLESISEAICLRIALNRHGFKPVQRKEKEKYRLWKLKRGCGLK